MKKSKAQVFFLAALALVSFLVYQFFADGTVNRGMHEHFRLNQTDDIILVELICFEEEKLVIQKHGPGEWFSNDSVKIDVLLVEDMLDALRRTQIRRPVPIVNRQQAIDDLTTYAVQVKAYAGRHRINLPGSVRMLPRKKLVYDVLVGFDMDVFNSKLISQNKASIPYEVHMPTGKENAGKLFTCDLNFWRDPIVVSLLPSEISNISVIFPSNPIESFALKMLPDTFLIEDKTGKKVDAVIINNRRLSRFLNAFRELTYEKYIATKPGQLPPDVLSSEPFLYQYITDTNGKTTELSYYYRKAPDDGTLVSAFREYDPNRFYLKTQHGDFALAQYYVFQPTMRPFSYFLEKSE